MPLHPDDDGTPDEEQGHLDPGVPPELIEVFELNELRAAEGLPPIGADG